MRCFLITLLLALTASAGFGANDDVRVKDLGRFSGWRENALVGYGVVTGLAGTGDSPRSKATRQSLANLLSQFNLTISQDQIVSRNVAVVTISANLPAFARPGDTLDVTVTSLGDARSLLGGALMIAPLKGPDGRVYALAQGPVSVGGYKYDVNGNVMQKNHPTVGSIPAGAIVEVGVSAEVLGPNQKVVFSLTHPDYTTASRIATAINGKLGSATAKARDAAGVEIAVSQERREDLVDFLTAVENLAVQPDARARVVINERTGTVVAGGDVRISKIVVSHGELKISVTTDTFVSQPILVRQTGPGVRTEVVSNSRVDVQEKGDAGFVAAAGNTVADLVQALAKLKTSTRDIISILQAVKTAGALHAELVIQ